MMNAQVQSSPQTAGTARWYAVYTYPNAERKVRDLAEGMGIESFLPLRRVVVQWNDRQKTVEVPLFPNYVFVKTSLDNKFALLGIKELVRFIAFGDAPVALRDGEMEAVRKIAGGSPEIQHERCHYPQWQQVRAGSRQFAGTEGVIVRNTANKRLAVQI